MLAGIWVLAIGLHLGSLFEQWMEALKLVLLFTARILNLPLSRSAPYS
jgi:hypothetical protein